MSRRAYGLRAWLWQRASAVYLALYILLFSAWMLFDAPSSYERWREAMSHAAVSMATALFFAALLIHAWVGVRDVVMDYVHPLAFRLPLLGLLGVGLAGCGLWTLQILYALR